MRCHKEHRPIQVRDFRCTTCGTIVPAPKTRHKTSKGHIKHMYCYVCKETTAHEQIE